MHGDLHAQEQQSTGRVGNQHKSWEPDHAAVPTYGLSVPPGLQQGGGGHEMLRKHSSRPHSTCRNVCSLRQAGTALVSCI